MRSARGYFLVEALLALALLSTVILVLINAYTGTTKSLTHSRTKKQVSTFAKADIERTLDLARAPLLDGDGNLILSGGMPVLDGYHKVYSRAEEPIWYPQALMGAETSTFEQERLLLLRTVHVSTVNAGQPDEYKLVRVSLRDSRSPERFSPVVHESIIRRPHPEALDTRRAVDQATLTVKLEDDDTDAPIPGGNNPRVEMTGAATINQTLPPPGVHTFAGLSTQGTYDLNFLANEYWNEDFASRTLSAGGNSPSALNPVQLQPVRYATVNVDVQRYDDSTPVDNATVTIAHDPGSVPSMTTCCGVNNQNTYVPDQTGTNGHPSGRTSQSIPIPVKGASTYGPASPHYRVTQVEASGYFTENFATPNIAIPLANGLPANVGPIDLYPKRYASLTVHVRDGSGSPLHKAYVTVYDGETLGTGNTNPGGTVSFSSIRVNWDGSVADKTSTSRTVTVRAQAAFHVLREQTVTLTEGNSHTVDFSPFNNQYLRNHYLQLVRTPLDPVEVDIGSNKDFKAQMRYYGHTGNGSGSPGYIDLRWQRPAGFSPHHKKWVWTLHDGSMGYLTSLGGSTCSSSTSCTAVCTGTSCNSKVDQIRFTALSLPGSTQLDIDFTYTFTYDGTGSPLYGPNLGSSSLSAADAIPISVVDNGAPAPTLSVTIGPNIGSVAPGSNTTFTANVSGVSPLPPDLTYAWSYTESAAGAAASLSPTDAANADLTAGDSSFEGETVTLHVTVQSSLLGQSASDTHDVTIAYSTLDATLPCGTDETYAYNVSGSKSVTASGGSGSYAYHWSLCWDDGGTTQCHPDSPSNTVTSAADGSSITFLTDAVPGDEHFKACVTDTPANQSVCKTCGYKVQPSGTSN